MGLLQYLVSLYEVVDANLRSGANGLYSYVREYARLLSYGALVWYVFLVPMDSGLFFRARG